MMSSADKVQLSDSDKEFMERAFQLAEEALENNEVPVGCVFVYRGKEVGRGRNEVNSTKDPTTHAEMVALRRMECRLAIKGFSIGLHILHDLVLYVTLEPCIMCASGLYELAQSYNLLFRHIQEIVYAAANERFGGIKSVGNSSKYNVEGATIEVVDSVDVDRSVNLLKSFYERQNPFAPEEKRKVKRKSLVDGRDAGGHRDVLYYVVSLGVVAIGVTFAAIPAYRVFCEKTSFGGLTQVADDFEKIARMKKVEDRLIRVQFNSDTPSSMQWEFKPQQHEMYVHPGETALAFYTAKNPTDRPIVGISSYNLTPFQAAYYFNKIQCFCFEEQILNPGEQGICPFSLHSILIMPMTQLWNTWTISFSATLSLKRSLVCNCLVPLILTTGRRTKNLENNHSKKTPFGVRSKVAKTSPVHVDSTEGPAGDASVNIPDSVCVPKFVTDFYVMRHLFAPEIHVQRKKAELSSPGWTVRVAQWGTLLPCYQVIPPICCVLLSPLSFTRHLRVIENPSQKTNCFCTTDMPPICQKCRHFCRVIRRSCCGDGLIVYVPNDDRFPKIEVVGNRMEHAIVHLAGKTKDVAESYLTKSTDVGALKQQMKAVCSQRNKKKLGKAPSGAGLWVEVVNDVGYRPISEDAGKIRKTLDLLCSADLDESLRPSKMQWLMELVTFAQIATDECDFGMGLELGQWLFLANHEQFDKIAHRLLATAYSLLGRAEYKKILDLQMAPGVRRRKELDARKKSSD
ncbi:cytidine and deoxycytidylate deaminase zinc-binding region [Ostertagia ostertagi]